jgi:hypothetical protein
MPTEIGNNGGASGGVTDNLQNLSVQGMALPLVDWPDSHDHPRSVMPVHKDVSPVTPDYNLPALAGDVVTPDADEGSVNFKPSIDTEPVNASINSGSEENLGWRVIRPSDLHHGIGQ